MSVEELFQALSLPPQSSYGAHFDAFLLDVSTRIELTPESLPSALDWLIERSGSRLAHTSLDELADRVTRAAWDAADDPVIARRFGQLILRRMELNDSLLSRAAHEGNDLYDAIQAHPERRRKIITAFVHDCTPDSRAALVLFVHPRLVAEEDVDWLIDNATTTPQPQAKHWAELACRMADPRDPRQLELLLNARRDSSAVREAFPWPESVKLGSPLARKMRKEHERSRQVEDEQQTPQQLDPPPQERVAMALEQCLGGEPELWFHLHQDLTLEMTSTEYQTWKHDVTLTPGWKSADIETRGKIVLAARHYVECTTPDVDDRIGGGLYSEDDIARANALRLLFEQAPSFLEGLGKQKWREWAPAVVGAWWSQVRLANNHSEKAIVSIAYRFAPDEVIATLLRVIDTENSRGDTFFVLRRFEACWDERLSSAAVERFLIDEADMTRRKRALVIDKMAAAYILQGALDRLRLL